MTYTKFGPFFNGSAVPPINDAFLNALETAAQLVAPVYNVVAYGAKRDGTTDDTAAIQAAVNAATTAGGGVVYFPAGGYWQVGTITFTPGIAFRGDGAEITSISHPTETAFAFSCSTDTTGNENHRVLRFEDMTVYSKYGVKVNDSDTFGTVSQQPIINGAVRSCRFLYPPDYPTTYANTDSATVLPTYSDLYTQGVGLHLTNCIDMVIQGCDFEGHGIGVLMFNGDVSTIRENRFALNSRHIYLTHAGTGGGRITIRRNDMLRHYRLGGIFTDCFDTTIDDNYFESILSGNPHGVPMVLRSEGNDTGLLFINNKLDIDSTASAIVSCAATYPVTFDNNHAQCATTDIYNNHSFDMRFDNAWSTTNPNPVQWGNNPGINVPHKVRAKGQDPYLFAEGSITPGNSTVGAFGSYPMVYDSTTNKYVLTTTTSPANLDFWLPSPTYRNFKFYLVGRKVGSNTGYCTITYVENGSTSTVSAGAYLGFSVTSGVETKTVSVSLPAGAQGRGYFEVALANDQVQYERVELVPVS